MTRITRAPNDPVLVPPSMHHQPVEPDAMSPARRAAIDALLASGEARSDAHALFKHNAGVVVLPD